MEHTSAMFKATRERVGLSQKVIHDRLGVNVRTVKRWEDPRYPDPPEAAWDLLEDALSRHREAVGAALRAVDRMTREAGHRPERVAVLYYRSQYQYDRFGRDRGGDWMVVDARARETAVRLEERGIHTVFYYPEEDTKLLDVAGRTRAEEER